VKRSEYRSAMNLDRSWKVIVLASTLAVAGSTGPLAHAAARSTAPTEAASSEAAPRLEQLSLSTDEELALLRQAYRAMESADHDYKGHRLKAMHEVQAAAKQLGVEIKGGGKGREAQGSSDSQMNTARGLLQNVRSNPADEKRDKVLSHVDKAIEQIDLALKAK
jgi:methionine-rich copper-binding protein CopC